MADNKSWLEAIKDFLRDYLPWTLADLFVYSTKGKVFLVSVGLAIVSALAFVLAPFSEPIWRLVLFTALSCFSLIALGTVGLAALLAYGMPSRTSLVIGTLFVFTWLILLRIYRTEQLLRADIDHYSMPRSLGPEQIVAISNYLQKFPSHTVAICADYQDTEASEYAGDIRNAVFQGGWNIDNCPEPAEELRQKVNSTPTAPATYQDLWNVWNLLINPMSRIEGLRLETRRSASFQQKIQDRRRPDLKNPDTDILLEDALRAGGVQIPQTGGGGLPAGAKEDEVLILTVGPRPRR